MHWNCLSRRKFECVNQTGDNPNSGFQLPVTHEYPQLARTGRPPIITRYERWAAGMQRLPSIAARS